MSKTEKLIVTGGAGLIGSNVVRLLNSFGYTNIVIVDKLGSSPYKWKMLSQLRFADYIEWDDFSANDFRRGHQLTSHVKAIIALGARSYTTEKDAAFLIRNNYEANKWLAERSIQVNARFVYASSAATYGADSAMNDSDDLAHLESLRPLNAYGYSKTLFDIWMAREGLFTFQQGAVGLKYTNVFSPKWEQHKGEQRSLVAKAYEALSAGQPITLFRSPRDDIKTEDIRRDFLGATDAAKVTVWFALDEVGRKQTGIYNVGSGKAESFVDLARFTAEAFVAERGEPKPSEDMVYNKKTGLIESIWPKDFAFPYITYINMPEHLHGRYQYFTNPCIAKLRAAGYDEPIAPLKEAIREYVGEMAREKSL